MISILYEDIYIIVVNKPAGLISEVNPFEAITMEGEVMTYLALSTRKPFLGVIHRLDRVTSGVMLFAKKKSALLAFNKLFELKAVQKTYHALINNLPPSTKGELINYLFKNLKEKRSDILNSKNKLSKLASLNYSLLQITKLPYLIELNPKTGRFHQIRAQLAHINCPILGDEKYGSQAAYESKGIALHAYALDFTHPLLSGKKKIQIIAPYPHEKVWLEQ
jgi:23S rRNA pseudouridine1911/1915/1917 synthase